MDDVLVRVLAVWVLPAAIVVGTVVAVIRGADGTMTLILLPLGLAMAWAVHRAMRDQSRQYRD